MRAIVEENELSYERFLETFASINKPTPGRGCLAAQSRSDAVTVEDKAENTRAPVHSERLSPSDVFQGFQMGDSSEYACSSASDLAPGDVEAIPARRRKMRKVSIDKLTSLGEAMHSAMTSRRTRSTGKAENQEVLGPSLGERRFSSWIFPPYFAKKLASEGDSTSTDGDGESSGSVSAKSSSSSCASGKPAVFRIPATRLGAAAHKGYLDCSRKKKKQWERFWCVLQDSCLYCYNTPQSEATRDAVLLRGYDVIANVTDLNRTRFVFRLQQKGVPTLYFASDNHRDFLLWVGTIERETRRVVSQAPTNGEEEPTVPSTNAKIRSHRPSLPSLKSPYVPPPNIKSSVQRTTCHDKLDQEMARLQRDKLLKEVSFHRQQIEEEQKILEQVEASASLKVPGNDVKATPTRRVSRDEVLDQYEKAREEEELKVTKFLTFLNRRRNSAQLKADQFSKELAPKNGRRRRDNHFHFSAMESRLREMQEALAKIDQEFAEEEANKLHNLEKLEQKRDLELLILEQRETIDILRRNQTKGNSHRRRHTLADALSPISRRSVQTLGSIDELSSVSDERMSSSTSTSSVSEANGVVGYDPTTSKLLSASTPLRSKKLASPTSKVAPDSRNRFHSNDGNLSSDADSGFQPSHSLEELDSSSAAARSAHLSKSQGLSRFPAFTEQTLKETGPTTSGQSADKEIDAEVLAKIEDFELFARSKLESGKGNT